MSACIYHDAEAAAICASCDFAVCQVCLDGGKDGVCATCYEEDAHRAERAERAAATEIRRCAYCRAMEDDETPLDPHGYCGSCAALTRCATHEEAIAFGQCQVCRSQYCRKCLGFEDICTGCKAKAAAADRPKPQGTKKLPNAGGTNKLGTDELPKKRPAGAPTKRGTGTQRPGTGKPGTGRTGTGKTGTGKVGTGKLGAEAKPPTRGQAAIQARLQVSSKPIPRTWLIGGGVAAVVLVLGLLVMLMSGGNSAEAVTERMQRRAVSVHQAVVHHYHKSGKLPQRPEEIKQALRTLKVEGASKIRIALDEKRARPESVIYKRDGETNFIIQASDREGELLKRDDGQVFYLDQFFDSGRP